MRRDLMEILVCPDDKGRMELAVEHEEDGDVITGRLTCTICGEVYQIEDSVPNLLPPQLRG